VITSCAVLSSNNNTSPEWSHSRPGTLNCTMDGRRSNKQDPNPRIEANILSKTFFWWLHPLLRLGYSKDLDINDLYQTSPENSSEILCDTLQREWNKELDQASRMEKGSKAKPSLFKAIWASFGWEFMFYGVFTFIEECGLKIGQPLCLRMVVRYFQDDSDIPIWQAYLYATGVVLGSALFTITNHTYFFGVLCVGMKIRIAACSLVYKKSLLLSQKALGQTTIGQMVNLLSNDVNRFDFSVLLLHYLWVGPLQALICVVILYQLIGPSCFAGFSILILFVPFQGWMGKVFSRLRMSTAGRTDERIRAMNEIISGMRVIKMYTWEKPFAKLIECCRKKEVDVIRRTACFRSLNMSLFSTSSKVILFLTFLVYVVSGNSLTSEKVSDMIDNYYSLLCGLLDLSM